ncbi:MAG: DNA methyltransferase [Myxococcota bacterium]
MSERRKGKKRGKATRSKRRAQHQAPPGWSAPRRALVDHGMPTEGRGDPVALEALTHAFSQLQDEEAAHALTHGFHAYPARMHPAVARACITLGTGSVLDPFCGSGTVLVEARVAGRAAIGTDLNPLGVRLSATKTALRSDEALEAFSARLRALAMRSEERVRERVPVRAPLPSEEVRYYAPHTLKELGGLHAEIAAVDDDEDRAHFEMLLSAIVVKFSKQRADTSRQLVEKTLRKGLVTEFFERRGEELVRRWRDLREVSPPDAPAPLIKLGDARELEKLLPQRKSAGLIVTSPPYGGTYDYVDHHARRFPWLGIKPRRFARNEMGARRRSRTKEDLARWDEEVGAMLGSFARRLRPGGLAILLMGDGFVGGETVPADEQLERLGEPHGFHFVAAASQPRPEWHANVPRREHLVALELTGS